jgi:hypothetical protein
MAKVMVSNKSKNEWGDDQLIEKPEYFNEQKKIK